LSARFAAEGGEGRFRSLLDELEQRARRSGTPMRAAKTACVSPVRPRTLRA
jgi:hypothetical protein